MLLLFPFSLSCGGLNATSGPYLARRPPVCIKGMKMHWRPLNRSEIRPLVCTAFIRTFKGICPSAGQCGPESVDNEQRLTSELFHRSLQNSTHELFYFIHILPPTQQICSALFHKQLYDALKMLLGAFSKIMGQLPKASQKKMGRGGEERKGSQKKSTAKAWWSYTTSYGSTCLPQDGAKMLWVTGRRPVNAQVWTTNGPDSSLSLPAGCDAGTLANVPDAQHSFLMAIH